MKIKNVARILFLTLFLFFICIYLAQATGYYKVDAYRKTALTSEAIERFEQDVKEGKNLEAKNYLEKEKNYKNTFNKIGMKSSRLIENTFNKIMKYIFKKMGDVVDENM